MPFPNGDPKPGEPGYTGYIAPENGGQAGVNYSDPAAPVDPAAPQSIDQKVQPTPYGGFDVAADKLTGGDGYGLLPPQVGAQTPGYSLDSGGADEERQRLEAILAQLQQQAATGDGAWQGALKDATGKANSSVMALGQSTPGTGYASALRNIGAAQGAVGQRAAGQESILRDRAKLDATGQLGDLLGGMGGQDASQAADAAAAAQSVRETNAQIAKNAGQQAGSNVAAAGQVVSAVAALSDGGPVPGRPRVFGDDERNDTVPAMLSPGEIVIPRSHAGSPEQAADFVRALQVSKGVQHMAAGGTTDEYGMIHGSYNAGNQEKPSIENGGLLNTGNYDATRSATLANADRMAQSAAGAGPSVAPQLMQNASDSNIAAAMQVIGGNHSVPSGDLLQEAGAAQQGDAGRTAETVAGEQHHGQAALIHALTAQRARDQSLALAKQQAALRNTQLNNGISAEQQAQLRQILGGVGQGIAAYSAAQGGGSPTGSSSAGLSEVGKSSVYDEGSAAADAAFAEGDMGDFEAGDIGDGDYAAHGGRVRMADGGTVSNDLIEAALSKSMGPTRPLTAGERMRGSTLKKGEGAAMDPEELKRSQDFVNALTRKRRVHSEET